VNFDLHYESTGPEILRQNRGWAAGQPDAAPPPPAKGRGWSQWPWPGQSGGAAEAAAATEAHPPIHTLVLGAGTGGTVGGVSAFLKRRAFPRLRAVLADPQGSGLYTRIRHGVMYTPLLAEGRRRRHQVDSIVEGVGSVRLTGVLERALPWIDGAVAVSDQEAVAAARSLLRHEGLFVGSSSAVNVAAILKLAADRQLPPGSVVLTALCDHGSRSLARFWSPGVLAQRGLRDLEWDELYPPSSD
jgi:cysteine synthase A